MSRGLLGVLTFLLSGPPSVGSLRSPESGVAHLGPLRRAPPPQVAPHASRVLLQVGTRLPEARASRTVTNDDEASVLHELRDLREDQLSKASHDQHGESEDSLTISGSVTEGAVASHLAHLRCPFGMPTRWKKTLDRNKCDLEYETPLYSAYRVGKLERPAWDVDLVLRFPPGSARSERAFLRTLKVLKSFLGIKPSKYFAQIKGYSGTGKAQPYLIWLQAEEAALKGFTTARLIAESSSVVPELVCGLRMAHEGGWIFGGITEESFGVFPFGRDYRSYKFVDYGPVLCKPGSAEFPCESISLDYAAPEIWQELHLTGSLVDARKKLSPAADLYSLGWSILMSFGSTEASRVFSSIQEKIDVIGEASKSRDLIKVVRTAASARRLLVELNASRSSDPVFNLISAEAKVALMKMTALDPAERGSVDDVLRDMYRAMGRIFSLWMWVMSISWCH